MYVVRSWCGSGKGETLQEAIDSYENNNEEIFDPSSCEVYEGQKVTVKRIFEIERSE